MQLYDIHDFYALLSDVFSAYNSDAFDSDDVFCYEDESRNLPDEFNQYEYYEFEHSFNIARN